PTAGAADSLFVCCIPLRSRVAVYSTRTPCGDVAEERPELARRRDMGQVSGSSKREVISRRELIRRGAMTGATLMGLGALAAACAPQSTEGQKPPASAASAAPSVIVQSKR